MIFLLKISFNLSTFTVPVYSGGTVYLLITVCMLSIDKMIC
jgi:hypothetical protein